MYVDTKKIVKVSTECLNFKTLAVRLTDADVPTYYKKERLNFVIKAIFFDLDDTLSDHRACEGEALRHVFAGFNIPYTQKVQDIFAPLDYALRNAGIPTIWFNPHNAPNTTDIIPDHTISHLSQLTQPISPHTITT